MRGRQRALHRAHALQGDGTALRLRAGRAHGRHRRPGERLHHARGHVLLCARARRAPRPRGRPARRDALHIKLCRGGRGQRARRHPRGDGHVRRHAGGSGHGAAHRRRLPRCAGAAGARTPGHDRPADGGAPALVPDRALYRAAHRHRRVRQLHGGKHRAPRRTLFVAARAAGPDHALRQLHPGLHAQAQGHRAKPDQHRFSRPADGVGGALHHGAALVHPRREHVLAPVSDRAREKRPVLRHLHLHGELSRLRHVRHLRRRWPRDGAARPRAHPRRAGALPHRRRYAIGARPRARTGARERAHGGGIHRLAHEQARLF